MEKYKLTKISMDQYTLEYKDQKIEFNSKVDYVSKLQEANKRARMQMIKDLSRDNMSIKDLTIEIKKDGKTYYDNSNKEFIEQGYIQEAQTEIFQDIVKEMMGKTLTDLVLDMELNETEVEEFGKEIGNILVGKDPSGK